MHSISIGSQNFSSTKSCNDLVFFEQDWSHALVASQPQYFTWLNNALFSWASQGDYLLRFNVLLSFYRPYLLAPCSIPLILPFPHTNF